MKNKVMESQLQAFESCCFLQVNNIIDFKLDLEIIIQSKQYSSFIIDMKQIILLDSVSLLAIISFLALAQKMKQKITFYNVSREVFILFELIQLDKTFDISESPSSGEKTCRLRL